MERQMEKNEREVMRSKTLRVLGDIGGFLFPRRCGICGRRLGKEEHELCTSCFSRLPLTRRKGKAGNGLERIFWRRINIVHVNALLRYESGADSRRLVLGLKYFDRPEIGVMFGRIMARDLEGTDFFDGIDLIIPVPLARKRLKKRGYNQSERLAQGVSDVTHIPIMHDTVIRNVENPTQTHLAASERKENVRNIFFLKHPETVKGKHVLLIDDVLTTGATLLSLAEEISKGEDVRFSILTLCEAGHHPEGIILKTY